MGLLWCCTPKLLTSFSNLQTILNRIIAVNHSKTYQSQSYYSRPVSQTSSPVHHPSRLTLILYSLRSPSPLNTLNQIIGVLHPKPPHQSQWDYWGAAPQTSSPVSMGLLWCYTPRLLTSFSNLLT